METGETGELPEAITADNRKPKTEIQRPATNAPSIRGALATGPGAASASTAADANREGTGPGLHPVDVGAGLPGDLAEVMGRWNALPAALRAGIVAMVRAAGK